MHLQPYKRNDNNSRTYFNIFLAGIVFQPNRLGTDVTEVGYGGNESHAILVISLWSCMHGQLIMIYTWLCDYKEELYIYLTRCCSEWQVDVPDSNIHFCLTVFQWFLHALSSKHVCFHCRYLWRLWTRSINKEITRIQPPLASYFGGVSLFLKYLSSYPKLTLKNILLYFT